MGFYLIVEEVKKVEGLFRYGEGIGFDVDVTKKHIEDVIRNRCIRCETDELEIAFLNPLLNTVMELNHDIFNYLNLNVDLYRLRDKKNPEYKIWLLKGILDCINFTVKECLNKEYYEDDAIEFLNLLKIILN